MSGSFPRTAGQSAAVELRRRILDGSIEPGTVLNQNELARAMGMSRIPIRDALRILAGEGLISMRAHASAVVAPLSLDDLQELYEIRMAIEFRTSLIAAIGERTQPSRRSHLGSRCHPLTGTIHFDFNGRWIMSRVCPWVRTAFEALCCLRRVSIRSAAVFASESPVSFCRDVGRRPAEL